MALYTFVALSFSMVSVALPWAAGSGTIAPYSNAVCTAISPTPTGAACGKRGQLKNPEYAADTQKVPDEGTCRDLCWRHSSPHPRPGDVSQQYGCYIYGYDAATHQCNSYYQTLTSMGFIADNNSSTTFSSLSCFRCPLHCPGSTNQSLLDNGNFDYSSNFAGPWLTSGGAISTPGDLSTYAFSCNSSDCSLSQVVPVCPGEVYRLIFDYHAASPGSLSISGGNLEGYDHLPATGSRWTSSRYWFERYGPGVTDMSLEFSNATGLTIDNVALHRVPRDFRPAKGAVELVQNGDFESGKLAPFDIQLGGPMYNCTVVSPGLNGSSHAVRCTGHPNDSSSETYLHQQINGLLPGTIYLLRFTVAKAGTSAFYPETYIGGSLLAPPYPGGSQYDFAMPFQARHASESLLIGYYYGPLLIDNISIKKMA